MHSTRRTGPRRLRNALVLGGWLVMLTAQLAATTPPGPGTQASLPSIGPSLVRMVGAFALVMAAGFGLLWVLRRGIRLHPRGAVADRKLQVLEVRMLGNRQSLCVVGYEDQRLLLACTATGVSLLTPLRPSTPQEDAAPSDGPLAPRPTFAEALQQAFGNRA